MTPPVLELLSLIDRCIREVLPELGERPIGAGDRLEELGANSMDRAEIVMRVLESLALNIPRSETLGPRNVGELAEMLHARLAQR